MSHRPAYEAFLAHRGNIRRGFASDDAMLEWAHEDLDNLILAHREWKLHVGLLGQALDWITRGWWASAVLRCPNPRRIRGY